MTMGDAGTVWRTRDEGLFLRIGAFLAEHRLAPDPVQYGLVHAILSDPSSAVAQKVARLTADGVRLGRHDLEQMTEATAHPAARPDAPRPQARLSPADAIDTIERQAHELVAAMQAQVDGFADIVRSMRRDNHGFGRDLANSAAAIEEVSPNAADRLSDIAGAMIARVKDSELRLARATDETEQLRGKLMEAHSAARRDPLTGLPNRLALAEAFAARTGGEYCLALCDIDRFKRINDQHGHGVGDRVLNMIGQALADYCPGHLVVRYGGEEFAVLLKGVNVVEAARLLDHARTSIAARRLRNRETDAPIGAVTFSAGVTAIKTGETSEQATDRADKLLYIAKAQGRDRVCAR
jgi:diguanylate cyclase